MIQLHFAQDAIVFANIGALFLCRAQADLLCETQASAYTVLPMNAAETLVECLIFEEGRRAPCAPVWAAA